MSENKQTSKYSDEQLVGLRESSKLFFDLFKHLTTLSAGSIVVLTGLLSTLFSNTEWKWLIITTLGAFVITTLSSIVAMFFMASMIKGDTNMSLLSTKMVTNCILVTGGSFVISLLMLIVFATKNIF